MTEKKVDLNSVIKNSRTNYEFGELLEDTLEKDPFTQFEVWLQAAFDRGDDHANAMTLSTAGSNMFPNARVVLLRNISSGGFTFYTNYDSEKGKEIKENSKACLHFFWKGLMRQVKIQGEIRFLPSTDSDDYFESRPFENKIGAWVSQQSKVVKNREVLDEAFQDEMEKYKNKTVPRPPHWGGYVLIPSVFEFWQGRRDRLHDRIKFTRVPEIATWKVERLMP